MVKLINRIPGLHLLISSVPGSALRMHVELFGKPPDVNKHSQSIARYTWYQKTLTLKKQKHSIHSTCIREKWHAFKTPTLVPTNEPAESWLSICTVNSEYANGSFMLCTTFEERYRHCLRIFYRSIKYLEIEVEFNLLQNLHLCTQSTRPFGEVGGMSHLHLSSSTHFAKIEDKKLLRFFFSKNLTAGV